MRAVIFHGPGKVVLEHRPIPKIQDPGDVIIQVQYTGLCGSDLHIYRGHEKSRAGFVMGHECTGVVKEVGSDVTTVTDGDRVVVPFTTSCSKCFYCRNGHSSRCEKGALFGSPALDGAQAECACRWPTAPS